MDVLKWIAQLFEEYGYGVLFFGLLLEFIALPFPGETTMAYAGYLSYAGTLDFGKLVLLAFLGTTLGMTITYFIGRWAGLPLFRNTVNGFCYRRTSFRKHKNGSNDMDTGLSSLDILSPVSGILPVILPGLLLFLSVNLSCMLTAALYSGSSSF